MKRPEARHALPKRPVMDRVREIITSDEGRFVVAGLILSLTLHGAPTDYLNDGNPGCNGTSIRGSDYFWAGAFQKNNGQFTANGISVDFSQDSPKVGPDTHANPLNHSLVEISANSWDSRQSIEFGWGKFSPTAHPVLFAAHTVDGKFIGYANNVNTGYVPSRHGLQLGDAVKVGRVGNFAIQYTGSGWDIRYDGNTIGSFPESQWVGSSFTQLGWLSLYGEVAASPPSFIDRATEMGNGILGNRPGAASISHYTLMGSSTPPDLSGFYQSPGITASYYALGHESPTGFTYGGPGCVNQNDY